MTPAVRIRSEDMLESAKGAVGLLDRHQKSGILAGWALQQGLVKTIEVFSEPAGRIAVAQRPDLGDLPRDQVTGMRRHLVNGDRAVHIEVLLRVVEERLPPLIIQREKRLGEEPTL